MDIKFGNTIKLQKELNALDRFVIDFVTALDKLGVEYVVVSGYVSILFGRSRSSEDIDLIIEKISFDKFRELWDSLINDFECIITEDVESAYREYLDDGHAIRFSRKSEFIPNIELKFPKVELESWALANAKEVLLNDRKLLISPIELQISFKLFLGSEKDIEDAKHLYSLLKDHLDMGILDEFNRKLQVADIFKRYLE